MPDRPNPNAVCMLCDHRKWIGPTILACDIDDKSIIEHGMIGQCPLGKFDKPIEVKPSAPPQPVPRAEWPTWAKGLALLSKAEDAGIGDTAHRVIGDFASEKFSLWHKLIFGTPCQCAARQAQWNQQYPLK